MNVLQPALPLNPTPNPATDNARIHEVARKFEGQFAQMLIKCMREASFGDSLFPGENQMFREMYDQQLAKAMTEGRVGIARKTKPVDGRPAQPGEVVVTIIKGEGVETRSKPAEAGDLVVRNRCPQTGNEEYLVKANRVKDRYSEPKGAADAKGWSEYEPKGGDMRYFVVGAGDGDLSFQAPWGEAMKVTATTMLNAEGPNFMMMMT